MDIMKSIATDDTVPFGTRERQGALPTLAATAWAQGTSVSAAGQAAVPVAGAGRRTDAPFDLTTGDRSASFPASPL